MIIPMDGVRIVKDLSALSLVRMDPIHYYYMQTLHSIQLYLKNVFSELNIHTNQNSKHLQYPPHLPRFGRLAVFLVAFPGVPIVNAPDDAPLSPKPPPPPPLN